jgi:hypothetical protein
VRGASGAAARIEQVLWSKQLALVVGVEVYAAFFGRMMLLVARAMGEEILHGPASALTSLARQRKLRS